MANQTNKTDDRVYSFLSEGRPTLVTDAEHIAYVTGLSPGK